MACFCSAEIATALDARSLREGEAGAGGAAAGGAGAEEAARLRVTRWFQPMLDEV